MNPLITIGLIVVLAALLVILVGALTYATRVVYSGAALAFVGLFTVLGALLFEVFTR